MRVFWLTGVAILGLTSFYLCNAQILTERSFNIGSSHSLSNSVRPLGNSVTDIVISGSTIWLGTGKGLSRSTNSGSTWRNYYNTPEFGEEDISAIAVHGTEVWAATAHSTKIGDNTFPEGSGLRYSSDWGESWSIIAQPRDTESIVTLKYNDKSRIRALGITTNINNITYDIAATDSAVWITSYAGMARKSTDKGQTWQIVILPPDRLDSISPTDSLVFDVSPVGGNLGLENNLNHRAFSVHADDWAKVWIGSAGGINKTTDGGRSWVKFNHTNQAFPISGNFVVAIGVQYFSGRSITWAATINAEGPDEKRGLSFSEDGWQTWKTALLGEFCHNIGFKNSITYVVSDNGIFRTADRGNTWVQPGTIYDNVSKQRITSSKFYSADAQGDIVWFGGSEGAAYTTDNSSTQFGSTWTILHSSQNLTTTASTYAYPNPFSPDDEVVRIHYATSGIASKVTIRIFDFGMLLVRTLVSNAPRPTAAEYDEVWDGKDDHRRQVTNGPYFYQVVIDNDKALWGKILVLQ